MSKKKHNYKKKRQQKKQNSSWEKLRGIMAQKAEAPLHIEKPWQNKQSIIQTVIVFLVMAAIAVYTGVTADEGQEWLWLSAFIIVAAAICNLVRFRYFALVEILLTALAPALVFMLVESYTHLLSQMWEGPVILNIIIYYLFFGLMIFLVGRTGRAIIIGSALLAAAGLANYFVLLFRSSPILPWDLYSIGVAATVADNFEYTLTVRACNVILLFMLLWSLCRKMQIKLKISRFRVAGAVVMLASVLAFGKYVQTDKAIADFNMDTTLFTPTVLYRNNGLVLSFVVNMRYLNVEKPEGYSEEALRQIQAELTSDQEIDAEVTSIGSAGTEEKPNIIVIMNEAFSDLSVLGDYETNVEVMPFINSLSENTQKGWMYASVKGGNTANTEFEFLTGLSMYYLPVGSIPYQQYIRSGMPALSSQLASIGYTSVAIHPYYSTGWNRNKIYDYFGFDETYFKNDLVNPEILRTYVSDWTTYEKIIERYESKSADEKLFVFDVTMQNHGSYVKRYDNFVPDVSIIDGSGTYLEATEQYLSLIKRSDEAFQQLVEYFAGQEEPTIILMFGDHQPADYVVRAVDDGKSHTSEGEDFAYGLPGGADLNERRERYMVPFIMWANYDIEENQGDETSANYLAVRLLEAAGLPLTDFQSYLKALSVEVPVISAHVAYLRDPEESEMSEDELSDFLGYYFYLQYNALMDTKHRLENFFTYREN